MAADNDFNGISKVTVIIKKSEDPSKISNYAQLL